MMHLALLVTLALPAAAQESTSTRYTRHDGEWTVSYVELDSGSKYDCLGDDAVYAEVFRAGKRVGEFHFCSTWTPEVRPVADLNGNLFVLLEVGEGRGPRYTSKALRVMLWNTLWFEEVGKAPVLVPHGFVTNWEYDYKVTKLKKGGIEIRLKGKPAEMGEPVTDPELTKGDPPFLLPGITLRFETLKPPSEGKP